MAKSKDMVALCGLGRANHLAQTTLDVVNVLRNDDNIVLADTYFGHFPDGELDDCFDNPEAIAGRHVLLFSSMLTDRFISPTLQLAWATHHHYGAKSVNLIAPVLPYRRQDHPGKLHEFHRNLWLMEQLHHNHVNTVVLVDPHSQQSIDNGLLVGLNMIKVDPTEAYVLALNNVVEEASEESSPIFVLAVDAGSLLRSVLLAKLLQTKVLYYAKRREDDGSIDIQATIRPEVMEYIGQLQLEHNVEIIFEDCEQYIKGAVILMREDESDTGGTSTQNGWRCRNLGATKVYLIASRLVFSAGWRRKMGLRPGLNTPFDLVFGGNAIYPSYEKMHPRIIKVNLAKPIGSAVARIIDEL